MVTNNLRHKARLVIGGHVTKVDKLDKYAATTSLDGVKLKLYVTDRSGKTVVSSNIGSADLNSYTNEKIWTSLGSEFGEDVRRAQVIKSLYGLINSAHAWYEIFTSAIRDFGFWPSKIMPCLWHKLAKDGESYSYLSRHVDDFLHTSDDCEEFLNYLRKKYTATGGVFPDVHLGMNIQRDDSGIALSSHEYIQQAVDRVKHLTGRSELKIYDTHTPVNWSPELDTAPLLDESGQKLYKCLIGIGIWLVCIGRFDIHFTINQLSRLTQDPREGHLEDTIWVFGFLQKWKNCGVKPAGKPMVSFWDKIDSRRIIYPGSMKDYYQDSVFEDLLNAPNPFGFSVEVNICVDASHADDKLDRKYATGILIYVDDMLIKSISRRQKSVATRMFLSEFLALKTAVEEAQGMRLLLQSIGVPIKGPINIHTYNESVLRSASNTGNKLKRKHVAISYNLVRENIATNIIQLWKIDTKLNPSDQLAKSLNRIPLHLHLTRLQTNINTMV